MFASRRHRVPRSFIAAGASVALAAGLVVALPGAAESAVSSRTLTGTVSIAGPNGGPVPDAYVQIRGDWSQYCYGTTDAAGAFSLTGCNLDDTTPFRVFIGPPQSLYSGDDTVDAAGASLFPGFSSSYTWVGLGGTGDLGNFDLPTANLKGIVKKQADDSTATPNDFYGNVVPLDNQGNRGNEQAPLFLYNDGSFRSYVDDTAGGVLVTAEPHTNPDPGTFDDTYAPTGLSVLEADLTTGASPVTLVMPQVNFWGLVKDSSGNLATNTWVEGTLGSGNTAERIWGRASNATTAVVGLYVDRTRSGVDPGDDSVTFTMNFQQSQVRRTYMLADDSGTSATAPMTIEPNASNLIVEVVRDSSSGPAEAGAQVNVNIPECNGNDCNVLYGTSDSSGEVAGYSADPSANVWVNVTPATSGYATFSSQMTPVLDNGVYRLKVVLLSNNLTITVRADGAPVVGAGLSLNSANYAEWLGYQETNGSGQVSFGVQDPAGPFEAQISQLPAALAAQGFASFNDTIEPTVSSGIGTYTINLQRANVRIRVVDESGTPVPGSNAWINPQGAPDNYSGQADDSGYVKLFMDLPLQELTGPMFIGASGPWNRRTEFSSSQYQDAYLTYDAEAGLWTFTAVLQTPNAQFLVVRPAPPYTPMAWTNLEFREPDSWMAAAWGNSDEQGRASVTLPDGSFDLYVDAPWNSQDDTIYARTKYSVTVANNAVTAVLGPDGQPVTVSSGRYVVAPLPALYSATVKRPDTNAAVANVWVEVLREVDGWQEYVDGSGTNLSGRFGLTLTDDTYIVRARAPWGSTGLAPSADCTLVIRDQQVAGESTCGDVLMLRTPNLTLNLVDGQDQPQRNAWACAGRENDFNWICEGSGNNGVVALLIDDTSSDLLIEANPPSGSEDLSMARKFILDDSFIAASSVEDTIVFPSPNVRVQVSLDDDTQAAMWSWVSIVEVDGNDWSWIGGGPANRNGIVNLNLDDTSGNYCVGVYPPWEQRSDFAPKEVCNVSLASGLYSANLLQANVFSMVVDADGRKNAWGWAEIAQDGVTMGGTGLDERGRFVAALPAGTYEVTFYPGWQRVGSPTTITVTVDQDGGSDIPDPIALGAGNVSGTVLSGSNPYVGVIIVATNGSQTVTAVSDGSGAFRLELDSGSWTVTAITPDGGTPAISFGAGVTWSSPTLVVP